MTASSREVTVAGVNSSPAAKICPSCGRSFAWRKRWARVWEQVVYCSAACRQRKVRPEDRALEARILALLAEREPTTSICPSEAARGEDAQGEAWRRRLEPVRRAARRLAHRGVIEITQGGRVVDPSAARGPIRLRRGPAFER